MNRLAGPKKLAASVITAVPTAASIMSGTYQPNNSTAPCIRLASMPQLAEVRTRPPPIAKTRRVAHPVQAISREDDWTGTKDAAARRRAQTRLNTRAYRKQDLVSSFA